MKICESLSAYLDGRLDEAGARAFEDHMGTCGECEGRVNAWRRIEAEVAALEEGERRSEEPTRSEAARLVERAEASRGAGPRLPLSVAASAILAGAIGVLLGLGLSGGEEAGAGDEEGAQERDRVYSTDALSSTTVRLGDDTLRLGPSGRFSVVESGITTRLRLERGSLACDVEDRSGGGGFAVIAGEFEVRVVGTRFLVDLASGDGGGRVVVSHGVVEVRDEKSAAFRLEEGEMLEMGEGAGIAAADGEILARLDDYFEPLIGPEAPLGGVEEAEEPAARLDAVAPAPDGEPEDPKVSAGSRGERAVGEPDRSVGMELWKQWVAEGRLDEARFALERHLEGAPGDVEGWSLLADCERKMSDWEGAIAALGRVIEAGDSRAANRARFRAASMLQDRLRDHGRAVRVLEDFLENAKPGSQLEARGRIRIARSLVALGNTEEARRHLGEVLGSGGAEVTREEARRMLEELGGE